MLDQYQRDLLSDRLSTAADPDWYLTLFGLAYAGDFDSALRIADRACQETPAPPSSPGDPRLRDVEDALALAPVSPVAVELARNVFCPTGKGGGVKADCKKEGSHEEHAATAEQIAEHGGHAAHEALEHAGHLGHEAHEAHEVAEHVAEHFGGGHEELHAAVDEAVGHGAEAAEHGDTFEHGGSDYDIHAIVARHSYGPAVKAAQHLVSHLPGGRAKAEAIAAFHQKLHDVGHSMVKALEQRHGKATAAAILGAGALMSGSVARGLGAAADSVFPGSGGLVRAGIKAVPGQKFIGAIPLLALAEAGRSAGVLGPGTKFDKNMGTVGAFVHGIHHAVGKPFSSAVKAVGDVGVKAAGAASSRLGRLAGRIARGVGKAATVELGSKPPPGVLNRSVPDERAALLHKHLYGVSYEMVQSLLHRCGKPTAAAVLSAAAAAEARAFDAGAALSEQDLLVGVPLLALAEAGRTAGVLDRGVRFAPKIQAVGARLGVANWKADSDGRPLPDEYSGEEVKEIAKRFMDEYLEYVEEAAKQVYPESFPDEQPAFGANLLRRLMRNVRELVMTPRQIKRRAERAGLRKETEDGQGDEGRRAEARGRPEKGGRRVAAEAAGPGHRGPGSAGEDRGGPPGSGADRGLPSGLETKIDRMEGFFRSRGQHEAAGWMVQLKEHVRSVGRDEAVSALGREVKGERHGGEIQYEGRSEDMGAFCDGYLRRVGITPLAAAPDDRSAVGSDPDKRVISSQSPSAAAQTRPDPYMSGDFSPRDPNFANKLEEAKHLPGLEKSEDLGKLMKHPVTHLDDGVVRRLDKVYGKGKWIVKAYGDDAYAGHGIYFPQRVQQMKEDSRRTLASAGQHLKEYGFRLERDGDGRAVGIEHEGGSKYRFGSPEYKSTIYGDARGWADKAASAADHENGPALYNRKGEVDGKEFMAQPAFEAAGVSDAERAAGKTIAPGEGRVHVVTKRGRVSIVPHSTWIKGEGLPVVFENDDTRAMAEAAKKAIEALPRSERRGQIYAPDVVKTKTGYGVVEANPANESGSSGYLGDNPFIIDSYVSHLSGREPAHIKFIRGLLKGKP